MSAETDEKTYLGRDLQDHIVEDYDAPKYGSRSDYLDAMLPDEATVHVKFSGGYQGEIAVVVEYNDDIWLGHDWYGSCSHCDAFLGNKEGYTEKLIRDLYCFDQVEQSRDYLNNSIDFGWDGAELRSEANDLLDQIE